MADSSEKKIPSGMEVRDYPASSSESGSDLSHMHGNEPLPNTPASDVNLSHTSNAECITGSQAERSDAAVGNEMSTEDRVAKEILFYERLFNKVPYPHLGIFKSIDVNIDQKTATSTEFATSVSHKNQILTDNCDLPRIQNFDLESNSDGIPSWRMPTLSIEEDPEIDWKTAKKQELVAFIAKKSRQIIGNCDLPRPQNFDDASCSKPSRVSVLQDVEEIDWRTATYAELAAFVSQKNRQVIDNCDLPRSQNNLDVPPPSRLPMQQRLQTRYITDLRKTGQHPLAVQFNRNARASFKPEDEALKAKSILEHMLFKQSYMAHTHRNLIRMHEMERECHRLQQGKMAYASNSSAVEGNI